MAAAVSDQAGTPEWALARHMRAVREAGGLAQTTLAARLNDHGIRVDGTAITRMEGGSRAIRLNEAVAIAAALDMTLPGLLHPEPSRLDEISIEVPKQPRTGSAVLDREGVAWQRLGTHWLRPGPTPVLLAMKGSDERKEWGDLLLHRGPVRLVWEPVEDIP